jgi:2-polyprenyl-3-methyl-5-hydroxy-6-metoxy-1,4-benzoquinol methylase
MYEKVQLEMFKHHSANLKDVRYKKIYRFLKDKTPGTLLEIGCADGAFLYEMKKLGWDCKGVEITPNMVKAAKALGLDVKEGDAQKSIPFDIKFDYIIAAEVIEHMVDVDKFLGNCQDKLKVGGLFIVTTPNLVFWVNRILMLFGRAPKYFAYADCHYRMFVLSDLKKRLEKYFVIEKILGSHVLASTRRSGIMKIFEVLGDYFPTLSGHFIVFCRRTK